MILDSFRLDGRVAAVTGGNRGLGQASALALAEAGADVALIGRTAPESTLEQIAALGRRATFVPCDLGEASPTDLHAAVQSVIDGHGRLDILVNNAGTIRRAPAADVTPDDWDDVLTVNLDAVFHLSQAAGRHMLDQGSGKIIMIASMLSYQGGIRVPAYTAAKHAVVGITKALANEWAAAGVNVNAIAPGYMATDNTAALRADPSRAPGILDRIPAARWGTPDDLKGAVAFLASDASSYLHGTVLPVDGGWLAR
ncbi:MULTISPECIES: 2-dehydro-3-deoxy-D-gluconate 5-dehydrogenase KduD [Actinoplanes]|uniref:2-dehydro-3-deoxy-D-gluconate 5-dehydrogenase KduD n=1 Tax=Actinoplanes TaxID=1865 RepID=UPI000B334BB3|nr:MULTISPECIES: 2-dehydro-3-deoxy-D-gluconate 5-dehydrogenase KduD [Actinoplanes]GLY02662.1 2-deoxy-D-gluconate 3-dehydrogenase [Actinoplanes sp. NBRC 101535]